MISTASSTPERRQLTPTRGTLVLVAISLGLAYAALAYLLTVNRTYDRTTINGPSASWSTMLSIAEREATKIDKDALLRSIVYASPPDRTLPSSYTSTLQLVFDYRTPSSRDIHISFQDSNPTLSLKIDIEDRGKTDTRDAIYELAQLAQNAKTLTGVRVTPREAVERTWSEVVEYARRESIPNPDISILAYIVTNRNEPLAWQVGYGITDTNQSTPDLNQNPIIFEGNLRAEFSVDAQTGVIIRRELIDDRDSPLIIP